MVLTAGVDNPVTKNMGFAKLHDGWDEITISGTIVTTAPLNILLDCSIGLRRLCTFSRDLNVSTDVVIVVGKIFFFKLL